MASSALAPRFKFPTGRDLLPPPKKSLLDVLDSLAVRINCRRGQVVCQPGQLSNSWYRVLAGAAEKYAMQADGRRQIVDLLLPGDFFGFNGRKNDEHLVEAVVDDTVIACYPRGRAEMVADTNPEVARAIRELVFATLARAESQILILGQMSAPEKVAAFLLSMLERLSSRGKDEVTLPVSRYEIADYLAISAETVSRSLTGLKHRGAISIEGTRRIKILDRESFEGAEARLN
jgi:CRP-like cAMP-binding protein